MGPETCGSLEILDHHLHALRSMPVNLSLNNNNTTTEHQGSKYGAICIAGGGKGGGGAAPAVVKTEGQMSMGVSCSGGSYQGEPGDQIRMVYQQSHCVSHAGYLKDQQRSTPDSTYEDAVEGEVRLVTQEGVGWG